jgi:hypothetical protein
MKSSDQKGAAKAKNFDYVNPVEPAIKVTAGSGRGIHSLEYCLYCYTPMMTTKGASQRCAHCGRVHLRIDHTSHWTKEPKLVALERFIKLSIAAVVTAFWFYTSAEYNLGPVSSFLFGPLLMLGGVMWWTAGLITRKSRYFSGRVLWGASIAMLVVGMPILLFVMDVTARHETFGAEYWRSYLILASPAMPMTLVALLLLGLTTHFEDFKARRLARTKA